MKELQVRLSSLIFQYKYSIIIVDKNVLSRDIQFFVEMVTYKRLLLTLCQTG